MSKASLEKVKDPMEDFASRMQVMRKERDPIEVFTTLRDIADDPERSLRYHPMKFNVSLNKHGDIERALDHSSSVFAHAGDVGISSNASYNHRTGEWKQSSKLWDEKLWMPFFENLSDDEKKAACDTVTKEKIVPVEALMKVAKPAPFGRDHETVFDESVRKALEIPANEIPTGLRNVFDSFMTEHPWEKHMKPADKKWDYKLYKMHMYGPGGKFEQHVDTLHDVNHIATVVLCLSSRFEGGTLSVEHLGSTKEVPFSRQPLYDRRQSTDCLEYAVFFTDCKHSVSEVTSGHRVVVQFDVCETTIEREERESDDEDHPRLDFLQELRGQLSPNDGSLSLDKEFTGLITAIDSWFAENRPHKFGFFLRHRYSLPALEAGRLKGVDRRMFDAFSKHGFSVAVSGVLAYVYADGNGEIEGDIEVSRVSLADLPLPSDSDSEDKKPAATQKELGGHVELLLDTKMAEAVLLREPHITGNEGNVDGFFTYYSAVIVIGAETGVAVPCNEKPQK